MKTLLFLMIMTFLVAAMVYAGESQKDTVKTSAGDLEISFLGHGTDRKSTRLNSSHYS